MSKPTDAGALELDLSANLGGFFTEAIEAVLIEHEDRPTERTTTYLGALLADFAAPGRLEALDRPVTLLLAEARNKRGVERFESLRSLGDGVLYISGFFAEHIEHQGVAPSYVQALGAEAYAQASGMFRGPMVGPDILSELSQNFADCVRLLDRVADSLRAGAARTEGDVLGLYQRWLKTGSVKLARALQAQGLTPIRGKTELN